MTTTLPTTALRHADLSTLATVLSEQHAMKHDFTVAASALRLERGRLVAKEDTHDITLFGVSTVQRDRAYDLSAPATSHLAERTGIPLAYWRRMADRKVHLLDTNANEWLADDDRTFFVRTFATREHDGPGIVRAVLSDRYSAVDNLDVLHAALSGVRLAGLSGDEVQIKADLTERRMHVRITAPQISVNVRHLIDRYRDPRSGRSGWDRPHLWSGIVLRNSEVGDGAFTVSPRAVLEVCTNGMVREQDVVRSVHVGSRMEAGIVRWSEDTEQRNLDLIEARTRDAVTTFLSTDFLYRYVADMEAAAGVTLTRPAETIQVVAQRKRYTEAQAEGILSHFIRGGDTSALGLAHAVTSLAQEVEDADTAAELEGDFFDVLTLAAANA